MVQTTHSFVKYQLIKHKQWSETASSLWNLKVEGDADFVFLWNEYLTSELGKKLLDYLTQKCHIHKVIGFS